MSVHCSVSFDIFVSRCSICVIFFFVCWSNTLNTQGEKKFQACKHTCEWINYIFIKKLPFIIPWFKVSPHLMCRFNDLKSVISVKYSPFVYFMRLVFIFAVLQWTIGGHFTVVTNVQIGICAVERNLTLAIICTLQKKIKSQVQLYPSMCPSTSSTKLNLL
jgi:hypothetical protein